MTTQKQIEANRKNAVKGGRPVATATLLAQKAKEYIATHLDDNLGPIVATAINQAIEGDKHAREWLADRGWGKASQPLSGVGDAPLFDNESQHQAQQAIADYLANSGESEQDED